MGLPIDPVLKHDEELQTCLKQLQMKAPQLFDTTGERFRQSEHERSLVFNNYWFTVVYDLLRQWGDRAEIIDWKTYLQPRELKRLKVDWQTRLYLYVLVETSQYTPEQATMTYWFVRAQPSETEVQEPQQVRITYSTKAHIQTCQDLQRLTDQLTALLEANAPFPQVPSSSDKCGNCPFTVRCQRGVYPLASQYNLPELEMIEEVSI